MLLKAPPSPFLHRRSVSEPPYQRFDLVCVRLQQRKPFVLCSPAHRQGSCTLCLMGTGLLYCLCKHGAPPWIPAVWAGWSDRGGPSGTTACSCRTGGVGVFDSAYTNAAIEVEDEARDDVCAE